VNLQDFEAGGGTHWVCYSTLNGETCYFDSYGDLTPPHALVTYLPPPIRFNFDSVQHYDQVHCGHLCLFVLWCLSAGISYTHVLDLLK